MFIVFTNSAWLGRLSVLNFGCQSVTGTLDSVEFRLFSRLWPTGLRPLPPRGRAMVAVRQPRPHWSVRDALKTPRMRLLLSFFPPSSLSFLGEKTEPPLPPPAPTCSRALATALPLAKLRPSLRLKPHYLLILLAQQAELWYDGIFDATAAKGLPKLRPD
jgi:hypothetical protein